MRPDIAVSLLVMTLGACVPTPRNVDVCALVPPSLAEALIGDSVGEPVNVKGTGEYAYAACLWEHGENSITVNAKLFHPDAARAAEQEFRSLSTAWKCTTAIEVSGDGSAACRYEADLDVGVIVREGEVVARVGYKGPETPQHDTVRQPEVAKELAEKALSAL